MQKYETKIESNMQMNWTKYDTLDAYDEEGQSFVTDSQTVPLPWTQVERDFTTSQEMSLKCIFKKTVNHFIERNLQSLNLDI
jgi:hypothetical protein